MSVDRPWLRLAKGILAKSLIKLLGTGLLIGEFLVLLGVDWVNLLHLFRRTRPTSVGGVTSSLEPEISSQCVRAASENQDGADLRGIPGPCQWMLANLRARTWVHSATFESKRITWVPIFRTLEPTLKYDNQGAGEKALCGPSRRQGGSFWLFSGDPLVVHLLRNPSLFLLNC